jgi:hypothetical protein
MDGPTHYAEILSSGRLVPVIRMGRVLIILHGAARVPFGGWHVSIACYNKRFRLYPANWRPVS